ncbi:MAG: selenocysteine-specific translation elongation factor [Polyangiales bacterium]
MTSPASDLVIGVAGHIDHGKTALVRALTGVDTDRLPEEKSRGITIELGFAPLTLPGGRRAAVVDMPGHERFVRTMIAGAGGVDVMLLIIAANEGVMPQTREHLAIAGLVGVRAGICVLTKRDLAAADIVELAADEARELLQGTALEGAPVVPVSAVTGDGIDALREAIASISLPPRDFSGPPLLAVDRAFVRKGFGVVVTGTLVAGSVREGDALCLGPSGPDHRLLDVRVRALQVHGASVTEARAGTRLAVNLAGVDLAEVPRGAWLFRRGELAVTTAFDAEVALLPGAKRALRRRAKLEVAAGATHALASLSLLEGDALEPGRSALARVRTDRPLVLRPGERLVLRGPPSLAAVGGTVGGAVVVRPVVERLRRRAVALERASRARGGPLASALVALEALGHKGLDRAELVARAGYAAREGARLVALGSDRFLSAATVRELERAVLDALSAHHAAHPAERGAERRRLSSLAPDAALDLALSSLIASGRVTRDGDLLARAGWKPRGLDDLPYVSQVRDAVLKAGLAAPTRAELLGAAGGDAKALDAALRRLLERREAVRVSADFVASAAAVGELEARLVAYLEAHGTIDAQGFKDLSGLTRKHAIPMMEHFDAKKLTLRVGDARKLRGR